MTPRAKARAERANGIVNRAVASGKLPRASTLKCVDCGSAALEYDHRDYGKPLDVEPVCHRCNCRRGPAKDHDIVIRGYGWRLRIDGTPSERVSLLMTTKHLRALDLLARKRGCDRGEALAAIVDSHFGKKK